MNPAYGAIARLYDKLMAGDIGRWTEYILLKLSKYSTGKTGADVGCGTGAMSRAFKRAGYNVFGTDISREMLAVAAENARVEGLDITYVLQDAAAFSSFKRLDFITSVNDCLNYLDIRGVKRAISRFAANLKRGGVLVFDISTEYKIKHILGSNMFGEDCDDYSYLWFNSPFDGGVEMDISLFEKEGKLYRKSEEHHVQYAHATDDIARILGDCGFDIVSLEGHLGAPYSDTQERAVFTAIKK